MTITNLPGQDWTDFLKAKLDDRNPKCGNCRFWSARQDVANVGFCQYATPPNGVMAAVATTDLSLCSAWEKKE